MTEKTQKAVFEESTTPSILGRRRVALSKIKRRILRHVWFLRGAFLAGIVVFLYILFLILGVVAKSTGADLYFELAKDFLFTPSGKVESINGRTNILILGKGGEGHEAPDLTDTIILASVSHKDPSAILFSIPRDIWINELRTKLNSIYYWGSQKQEGGGIVLAKATIEEVVGQPVHYAVVVDFSGFKKIIDALDGIQVNVERSFTDERYPIAGRENDSCNGDPEFRCRYETVSFTAGQQYMDGETALKFVRSRNAEGDEGTDFARAARQQRIIQAIKEKALSRQILLSPKKLVALKETVLQSIETDLTSSAGAIIARRLLQAKNEISSQVLPKDLLINPPKSPRYDNLYVFIPRNENWDEVHEWVACVLEKRKCD